MSFFGDLEDGVARLLALRLSSVSGGYLKKIAAFGGTLEDLDAMREELRAGSPMALVQYQPSSPTHLMADGTYRRDAIMALMLCDRSTRGMAKQRRGSGHSGEPPGIYQMVEDACDDIVGKVTVNGAGVALGTERWQLMGERTLFADKDLQMWMLSFKTQCTHTWAHVDRAAANDLTSAYGAGHSKDSTLGDYDDLEMLLNTWP